MQKTNLEQFNLYKELLIKWQKSINLISPASISQIEIRHFLDSAQIYDYINEDAAVADLGSGAGFPGMILAILGINTTLIESDQKKCLFLKEVARHYKIHPQIICSRIEDFSKQNIEKKFDVITARALTSLIQLLDYATPLLKENGKCIFLKGEKADLEIIEAQKKYMFHVEHIPSKTDANGKILILSKVKKF